MNQDEKISMENKMNRHTSIFDQALSKYYKNIFFYFNMFGLDQLTRMDVGTSSLTCPSLSKEKKIIYLCYLDPLRKA